MGGQWKVMCLNQKPECDSFLYVPLKGSTNIVSVGLAINVYIIRDSHCTEQRLFGVASPSSRSL